MSKEITANAMTLRPVPRTQAELERQHALEYIAAIMRKTGHAELRLRFLDLHTEGFSMWFDHATDEMVFLNVPKKGTPPCAP